MLSRLIPAAAFAALVALPAAVVSADPRPEPVPVVTCGDWSVDASIGCPTWDGVYYPQLQDASDAVTLDTGDGIAVTGPAEVARIAEATALDETEDEYHDRLCLTAQEVKPWLDLDCDRYSE